MGDKQAPMKCPACETPMDPRGRWQARQVPGIGADGLEYFRPVVCPKCGRQEEDLREPKE